MQLRIIGALVTSVALIAPAQALGKTYCVYQPPNPQPPPPCDSLDPKVQDALSKAQSNVGADVVRIGAGSFLADASTAHSYIGGPDPVEIVGAGPATRLLRTDNGIVLDVSSTPQSTISNLTVVPLPGSSAMSPSVGVRATNAKITSVTVDPSNATANVTGFELGSGELNDVSALLPSAGGGTIGANFNGVAASASASIYHSSFAGAQGLVLSVPDSFVDATRISALYRGVNASRNLSIANSLIRMTPSADNQFGLWVDATQDATAFARNLTIVADNATASSSGVYARAFPAGSSVSVNVYVNSSIVRGFTFSFSKVAQPPPPPPTVTATASITPTYSDFPPTAPGYYTPDASNVNVDPAFVPGDYTLAPNSPVIDKGLPGTLSAGGSTGPEAPDLAGNPRVVDGNGDGTARRDIGAFEYQPPAPPPGTTPGGTTPGGAATPGASGGGGPSATATSVTALKLSPTRFRAATSGPPVTAAAAKKRKSKPGTIVAFTLTQPGSAAFSIERKTSGRRSGGKCAKATRKNRKAKKCTLYTLVKGSAFTRDGVAGANKFRLTGRVGKKALKAGAYRLVATTTASVKRTSFKIVR